MGMWVLEHICRAYVNPEQSLEEPSHPAKGLSEAGAEPAGQASRQEKAKQTGRGRQLQLHPHLTGSCSAGVEQKKINLYRELPQNGTKD